MLKKLSVLVAMMIAGAAAVAQDSSGLEEVVVTAQRKVESLQDAGIAIDATTGGDILEAGVTQITDLGKLFPSLDIQNGGGAATSLFLRGVGNFTNTSYSDPAVALSYSGVYIARSQAMTGMFYDLARVEVLKGPQGTLYGRNATGGAINVLPAEPEVGEDSGFVSIELGNYNRQQMQGAANIAVGDSSALRLSANVNRHDAYNTDGTSDEESEAFRVQFKSEVSDATTIKVGADYAHNGGVGTGSNYIGAYDYPSGYTFADSGFDDDEGLYTDAAQAYQASLVNGPALSLYQNFDVYPHQDNSFYGANVEVNTEFDAGTLTAVAAVRGGKVDNVHVVPGFVAWNDEEYAQSSLELRFAGDFSDSVEYLVGAYYFDEEVKGNDTFNPGVLALQDFTVNTESAAVFGKVTWAVSDAVRLTAGLRYTQDEKSIDAINQNLLVLCDGVCFGAPSDTQLPTVDTADEVAAYYEALAASTAANGTYEWSGFFAPIWTDGTNSQTLLLFSAPQNESMSEGKATYRLAAEWDVAADSMVYASYETGYRSGGFSMAVGKETYAPEYLDAFTLGVKNEFADNTVQLNLETFYWEYSDQQLAHFGIDGTGGAANFTENVGQSTILGFDLDVKWLLPSNSLLTGKVQYLDGKYDELVYIAPTDMLGADGASPNPTTCDKTDLGDGTMSVDCSGNRVLKSPKWIVNLGLEHDFKLGNFTLTAAVDTQFKDEHYAGFEYTDQQKVAADWIYNALLTLTPADEVWSVSAFVRNIDGDRVSTNSTLQPIALAVTEVNSAPRTYGIRAQYNF